MASSTLAASTMSLVSRLFSFTNSSSTNVPSEYPFYYVDRPNLFNSISDKNLVVVVPFVVFWIVCISFDILDNYAPAFLQKYRIHESAEEMNRNRVSKMQVIAAVLFQQAIQTALGLWWVDGVEDVVLDPLKDMKNLDERVSDFVLWTFGMKTGIRVLTALGPSFVWWLYWWGIPLVQYAWAL
jgi:sphinganine C4-monooxygenase